LPAGAVVTYAQTRDRSGRRFSDPELLVAVRATFAVGLHERSRARRPDAHATASSGSSRSRSSIRRHRRSRFQRRSSPMQRHRWSATVSYTATPPTGRGAVTTNCSSALGAVFPMRHHDGSLLRRPMIAATLDSEDVQRQVKGAVAQNSTSPPGGALGEAEGPPCQRSECGVIGRSPSQGRGEPACKLRGSAREQLASRSAGKKKS